MAYGVRVARHQGTLTRLGRSMAGSQGVIAHAAAGQARCVGYAPPDMALSQGIVAYCQPVAGATGPALLVIEWAVHAVAMARAFNTQG